MDGLYQDVIIMLTIFICGLVGMRAYYKLRIDFDELQTDFHRLAEGRDYVEDIDQQAYAQGREWAGLDLRKMQEDIISLKQGTINLNAKINEHKEWSIKSIGEITQIVSDVTSQLPTVETMNTMAALGRISVQDVIDIKND